LVETQAHGQRVVKKVPLTDAFARSAPVPTDKSCVLYHDAQQPAFCLRVNVNGSRSWCIDKWASGRMHRIHIATTRDLPAAEARKVAKLLIARLVTEAALKKA
jgi:hypothetical protein